MKYLIQTTEIYRVESEEEALEMIEKASSSKNYSLKKGVKEFKEKKKKDEYDAWWRVTLVKDFTSEKEPESQTTIKYEIGEESAF